jgi:hypothetical protein
MGRVVRLLVQVMMLHQEFKLVSRVREYGRRNIPCTLYMRRPKELPPVLARSARVVTILSYSGLTLPGAFLLAGFFYNFGNGAVSAAEMRAVTRTML